MQTLADDDAAAAAADDAAAGVEGPGHARLTSGKLCI